MVRVKELEDDEKQESADSSEIRSMTETRGWEILRLRILDMMYTDRERRDKAPREPIFYELKGKQSRAQEILDLVDGYLTLRDEYKDLAKG